MNLSALSPTLIESELFGHRRGAFTGAVEDRAGWLETCGPLGAVFLDEIGELDAAIQVKLLRVLQTPHVQRIGEIEGAPLRRQGHRRDEPRSCRGDERRALSRRSLLSAVRRLIRTPTLREQLADSPADLGNLCLDPGAPHRRRRRGRSAGRRSRALDPRTSRRRLPVAGQRARAGAVRAQRHDPRRVPSAVARRATEVGDQLFEALREGSLSADDLLRHYCTLVFLRTGSYLETARRLGIDRRTVRAKVDPSLLAKFRQ